MSFTMNAANFLMLSVFAIAAFGYILGRITIKGISLGTAGVFVIALIYGGFFGVFFQFQVCDRGGQLRLAGAEDR